MLERTRVESLIEKAFYEASGFTYELIELEADWYKYLDSIQLVNFFLLIEERLGNIDIEELMSVNVIKTKSEFIDYIHKRL